MVETRLKWRNQRSRVKNHFRAPSRINWSRKNGEIHMLTKTLACLTEWKSIVGRERYVYQNGSYQTLNGNRKIPRIEICFQKDRFSKLWFEVSVLAYRTHVCAFRICFISIRVSSFLWDKFRNETNFQSSIARLSRYGHICVVSAGCSHEYWRQSTYSFIFNGFTCSSVNRFHVATILLTSCL